MKFTAEAIASYLKGEVKGDPNTEVYDVAKIEEGKPGTLSFLANPKYAKYLYETDSSIVLINKDFELEREVKTTLILVEDAYLAFASLLDLYVQQKPQKEGIETNAFIHENAEIADEVYIGNYAYISEGAKIGKNVKIYPQVFIGENVSVGDNTILYPGVKIYEQCIIGSNCIVHSSSVIGSDGFGFAPNAENNYKKIPQIGNVILEDHVEVGSNVSIDRATMGSTVIRKGVKIDNLIQIAHNVEIGENTVVAAQSGIAGSTKIGKNVMLAAQVGIVGHIEIADNVLIAAQSGIGSSVRKQGAILLGTPAAPIGDTKKSMVLYKRLPELNDRINQLEKELKALKAEQNKA